jgi:hypothetical protein
MACRREEAFRLEIPLVLHSRAEPRESDPITFDSAGCSELSSEQPVAFPLTATLKVSAGDSLWDLWTVVAEAPKSPL